ncbi:MAG: ASCH domain-containing protein [Nanoarchaeota archaeon]
MKALKFREKLGKLILKGEKTSTWRFFDDKNISKGDIISMIIAETGKEFAKSKVTNVIEKNFGELTRDDKKDHEKFNSDKEMYETYSGYYKTKITPKTKVKIIKFELIK